MKLKGLALEADLPHDPAEELREILAADGPPLRLIVVRAADWELWGVWPSGARRSLRTADRPQVLLDALAHLLPQMRQHRQEGPQGAPDRSVPDGPTAEATLHSPEDDQEV